MKPTWTSRSKCTARLKLPTQELDRAALEQRYPQVYWKDIEVGLLEPQFGVLMARRAVQTLVKQFVKAGGEYRVAAVKPPGRRKPLARIEFVGWLEPSRPTTCSPAVRGCRRCFRACWARASSHAPGSVLLLAARG